MHLCIHSKLIQTSVQLRRDGTRQDDIIGTASLHQGHMDGRRCGNKQLQRKLAEMRSEYSHAGKQEKDKMSAAILDLEQRVRQLSAEAEQTAMQVRNLEKQATK